MSSFDKISSCRVFCCFFLYRKWLSNISVIKFESSKKIPVSENHGTNVLFFISQDSLGQNCYVGFLKTTLRGETIFILKLRYNKVREQFLHTCLL